MSAGHPKCPACHGDGYTLGAGATHECDCVRDRIYDRSCPVCALLKAKKEDLVCASCWTLVPTADQEELIRLRRVANGSDAHRIKCNAVVRDIDRRREDLADARRCSSSDRPAAECRCPDCGPCLVDYAGE